MSHNTHVFLTNETGDAEQNISLINSSLDTSDLSSQVDYYTVYGVINLSTGEYTREQKIDLDGINSIESLENFANSLFDLEQYRYLQRELNRLAKSEMWWNCKNICERLDGMAPAVKAGKPWTAKMPFGVNDGYFNHFGITDWRCFADKVKNNPVYAVIVDFHS